MKKLLYLLTIGLFTFVVGCKKPVEADVATKPYFVKCNVNGDPLDIYAKDNNVYAQTRDSRHYFTGDKGKVHISFGFLDTLIRKPTYRGGTYILSRMDYGSGIGFGSFDDGYDVNYQTHYSTDTGVLVIAYSPASKIATGTFYFTATQTNPKPGESPIIVDITDGTFSMMWDPN
jgi:hypothetical protein